MTGRQSLLTPAMVDQAMTLVSAGTPVVKVAELLGVSPSTIRRSLRRVLPDESEPVEELSDDKPVWPPAPKPDEEYHLVPLDDGTGRMLPTPVRWVRLFSNTPHRVEVGPEGSDIYCSGCAAFVPAAEAIAPGNSHRAFPRPVVGALLPIRGDDGRDWVGVR